MSKLKVISAALVVFSAGLAAQAVTLSIEDVSQRYPWNGLVDIDYRVTYADGESELDGVNDRLRFIAIDKSRTPYVTNVVAALSVAPIPTSAGAHRITWDANSDRVNYTSTSVTIELSARRYAPKYMIVDVSEGKDATSYPVTYTDVPPTGGWCQDEYRGSKIVFRLIPAGSYVAGSPTTEPRRSGDDDEQHNVAITKPFYCGIFEVTQKQWFNVMGTVQGGFKGEYRPVESLNNNDIRGKYATYLWPVNKNIDPNSFVGKLRTKAGLNGFDLPTEGQWEYACRAGATGPLPTNEVAKTETELNAQLAKIGRYNGNKYDGKGNPEYTEHTTVGSYQPNAWGLYDMIGNVLEQCLDYQGATDAWNRNVDPVGPETSNDTRVRMARGGSYYHANSLARCAAGTGYGLWNQSASYGIRLICNVE